MWKSIRTTNALENLNREFRRRRRRWSRSCLVSLPRVRSDYDVSMVTSTSPTFLLEARSPPDLIPVVSKNTNELKTGSPERFRLEVSRLG